MTIARIVGQSIRATMQSPSSTSYCAPNRSSTPRVFSRAGADGHQRYSVPSGVSDCPEESRCVAAWRDWCVSGFIDMSVRGRSTCEFAPASAVTLDTRTQANCGQTESGHPTSGARSHTLSINCSPTRYGTIFGRPSPTMELNSNLNVAAGCARKVISGPNMKTVPCPYLPSAIATPPSR